MVDRKQDLGEEICRNFKATSKLRKYSAELRDNILKQGPGEKAVETQFNTE